MDLKGFLFAAQAQGSDRLPGKDKALWQNRAKYYK